ncbi:MAG: type II secretion system protein [Dehalococcoidia bacterium]
MKKVHRPNRREKGFTLIELLVVVAILGVLAAVVVPNVSKFIGKGNDEAKATEMHNVQLAVHALLADSAVGVLDGATAYAGVDEIGDADLVVAGGGAHKLSEYLNPENFPLKQAYTIQLNGTVSVPVAP